VKLIEANLAALGAGDFAKPVIIRAGLAEAVARLSGEVFDLIILDPPYAHDAAADALGAVQPVAGASTRVIVEHSARHAPPESRGGLRLTRTVTAGDSALSFYER